LIRRDALEAGETQGNRKARAMTLRMGGTQTSRLHV